MHPQGVNPIAPPPLPLIEPCIYTTQLARSNCVAPFLHFCTRGLHYNTYQVTALIKQTHFYPVHEAVITSPLRRNVFSTAFCYGFSGCAFCPARIRNANDALNHVELAKKFLFFCKQPMYC